MDWFKRNQSLATLLGALLVVIGLGFFLWTSASGKVTETKESLDQVHSEIDRLRASATFPSADNIEILKTASTQIAAALAPADARLNAGKVAGEEMNPIDFQTRLRQVRDQLTATAGNLPGRKVEMPPNFTYGFSKYEAAIPTREATPYLTKQLNIINQITQLLFKVGIVSLKSVSRSPVEALYAGGAPASAQGKTEELLEQIDLNREELPYTILPFVFKFVCDDSTLRDFVNQLTDPTLTKAFYLIRSMEIRNQKVQPPTINDLKDPAKLQQSKTLSEGERVKLAQKLESIDPIIIFGNEMLDVSVRVDYIELKPPDAVAKTKPVRKKP